MMRGSDTGSVDTSDRVMTHLIRALVALRLVALLLLLIESTGPAGTRVETTLLLLKALLEHSASFAVLLSHDCQQITSHLCAFVDHDLVRTAAWECPTSLEVLNQHETQQLT